MEKEAKLQLTVAAPAAAPSPEAADRHLITRLTNSGAAVRPFLAHNELLTDSSDLPMIHVIEAGQAGMFVRNFKDLERALQHRMGVRYGEWHAPDSYRDDLSKAVAKDKGLYQQVAGYSNASKEKQLDVINTLARQLQMGATRKATPQME